MNRATDFAVGLTIRVGTVVLIVATLWVKQADFGRDRATVVARFHDVGGVRIGTPVVIRGVRAGRVEAMELSDSAFVLAKMALDPDVGLPVDPVVLLNESSLFGEWQATITSRDAVGRDADVIRQLAETSRDDGVLPGATLPDIARLTAVAGRIAGDVASVAERVQVAFDDQAARELRTSVRSFSEMSTVLAQTVREQSNNLTTVSSDVRGGVQSLVHSAELLKSVAERVDSSTSRGEVRRIVDDAGEAARRCGDEQPAPARDFRPAGSFAGEARVVPRHQRPIARRIQAGEGLVRPARQRSALYRNADSAMRQLNLLLADIQKNPRRYVNSRSSSAVPTLSRLGLARDQCRVACSIGGLARSSWNGTRGAARALERLR
jgi:phospholipid/cholesterol/gamma-HCH transport system substrate-binding protein